MKAKQNLRRALLFALVFVGAPLFFFFWYAPSQENLPIAALLPQRMAGAVRLNHLQQAWTRHWNSRAAHLAFGKPAPAPEDALMGLMDAAEQWPKWVKKYGETQARLRLRLYQSALFTALGEDAWLVLGEWDVAQPESNEQKGHVPAAASQTPIVGLVIYLRGEGQIMSRVGPLMKLAFPDYKVESAPHDGVTIYEYKDRRLGHSLSFCQLGGWIVASWRQQGTGPLPFIIDQARHASHKDGTARLSNQKLAPLLEDHATTPPALRAVFYPPVLWGEYRQFQLQRERKISPDSENMIKYWQQRLDGVEQAFLTQSGPSIFDLDFTLTGSGPQRWHNQWQQEARSTTTLGLTATTATTPTVLLHSGLPPLSDRPELAVLDVDLPFARMALPLAGFVWEDVLESARMLDLFVPGLRKLLLQRLTAWSQPAGGRMGLSAFAGSSAFIPDVLGWIDLPPLQPPSLEPAGFWRDLDRHRERLTDPSDQLFWLRLPLPITPPLSLSNDASSSGALALWPGFRQDAWRGDFPPLGFLAVNFTEFATVLDQTPEALVKKKQRRMLRRWRRTAEALSLGLGAATLRIDGTETQWRMRLRTL